MTATLPASPEADVRFSEAGERRHAALARSLHLLTETLVAAVRAGEPAAARQARRTLVAWCEQELLPHLGTEEQAMYPAVRSLPEGRFLARALLGEHEDIRALVQSIMRVAAPADAAGAAVVLRTVFNLHAAKEHGLLVPLLVSASAVAASPQVCGPCPPDDGRDADAVGPRSRPGPRSRTTAIRGLPHVR